YRREEIDAQLKTEFVSALQPAFGKLSELEIRPNQIVTHNTDLENAMNQALSQKWGELRGLEVVSVALGTVTLPEEDQELIKIAQRNAMYRDPTMGAAAITGATADAMGKAAENSAGAMTGFMGMGMAMNAGGAAGAQNLYAMGMQQEEAKKAEAAAAAAAAPAGWQCACGAVATGNFCPQCGAKKPADEGWTCACGAVNKGRFCTNCGAKKPEDAPLYKCDKCGWEPEDPKNPPKFCPECGDIFDDRDRT
ncbi:MAG: SPFH domain-containing protein, partial [Clostridia bacterium]|nr:SPFH domain-containing protein [Clostridia bacterium]